jgi:hypothetical protein
MYPGIRFVVAKGVCGGECGGIGWERENEIDGDEVKVDGKSVDLIGAGAYGRGVCGEDCGCGID